MNGAARSFRLDASLADELEQAARAQGVPVSQFVRDAIRERCQRVFGHTLRDELADVIGAIDRPLDAAPDGAGNIASQTGRAFKGLLLARERQ